jgi:hypothetical protein
MLRPTKRSATSTFLAAAAALTACSSAPTEEMGVTSNEVTRALNWEVVAGCATEIAVGGSGGRYDDVWVLGCGQGGTGGRPIYRRNSDDSGWGLVSSNGASKIAVDLNGDPWIVTDQGKLLRGVPTATGFLWYDQIAPCTRDLAVGVPLSGDGRRDKEAGSTEFNVTPWILGCTGHAGGSEIRRLVPKPLSAFYPSISWDLIPGSLRTIRMFPYDALPQGTNTSGGVFTSTGTSSTTIGWIQGIGCANDLGVGLARVGAVSCGGLQSDNSLYVRPRNQPGGWDRFEGAGVRIAEAAHYTWVINSLQTIYRLDNNSDDHCGEDGRVPCEDLSCKDGFVACFTSDASHAQSQDTLLCAAPSQCGSLNQSPFRQRQDLGCYAPLVVNTVNGFLRCVNDTACGTLFNPVCINSDGSGYCKGGLVEQQSACMARRVPSEDEGCGGKGESCCTNPIYTSACISGSCGPTGLCGSSGGGGGGCAPTASLVCGETCPAGTHVTRWENAADLCAESYQKQVICTTDCGTVLDTCGTTCPNGYHETSSDCVTTCGICPDNGNGRPLPNHRNCTHN